MKTRCIALAVALSLPMTAQAEPKPEVAVWRVAPGKLPKPKVAALHQALSVALGKIPGVEVIAVAPAARKALKQLEKRRCAKPTVACTVEAGSVMGATHALAGVIKGGRELTLELWVVDVAKGKKLMSAQGVVRAVSIAADVEAVVGKLAAAFRAPVGSIVVGCNVDGAEVRLDGKLLGRTPFAAAIPDIAVGAHEVHVAADGYAPYAGALEVRQGAEVRIFAELAKSAPVVASARPAPEVASAAPPSPPPPPAGEPDRTRPQAGTPADTTRSTLAVTGAQKPEVINASLVGSAPGSEGDAAAAELVPIPKDAGIGLSLSVGPLLLVPTARVGATGGATLDVTYFPPLFESKSLSRLLGVSLEGGWYPLSGRANSSFSAYTFESGSPSWTTTEFVADWKIQTYHARLAVLLRLSAAEIASLTGWSGALIPEIYGRLGGAAAYGKATATLSKPGAAAFATNNEAEDYAWGFYAAVGGGFGVGPGAITLEYQYSNLRLDFKFPEWNPDLGDLGGNTWRLGYRLDF